ncbi:MAG: SH3 domain-containing protein [Spirochaetales bacterium]|nr:SH3 domain-containing protein [Spirochaetales bacterium]
MKKIKVMFIVLVMVIISGCSKTVGSKEIIEKNEENKVTEINQDENYDKDSIELEDNQFNATLNDNSVRLREDANLNCETISFLEKGDSVMIILKSSEMQEIDSMKAYWYKVMTTDDEIGWVYGYFLDIKNDIDNVKLENEENNNTSEDYLSYSEERISNLIFNKDIILDNTGFNFPIFKNNVDKEIYLKLAGIYIMNEPKIPGNSKNIYLKECSWGKDYSFGRGSYVIDYNDGIWYKGGDGYGINFTVKSYSDNKIDIDWGEKTTPRYDYISLKENYIEMESSKYYRISSPEDPMWYLRDIIENRKNEKSKYNLLNEFECKNELEGKLEKIYGYLKNNNSSEIIDIVSKDKGLELKFNPNKSYSGESLSDENVELLNDIEIISNDLNNEYCPDFNKSVMVFNKYLFTDLDDVQEKYPNSILVEMIYDESSYLTFVFIKEDGIWMLTSITNHSLDFA